MNKNPGCVVYNLGTGTGNSVMDLVNGMKEASGKDIAYQFVARRPGDIATCYSSAKKAEKELGWTAKFGIKEICRDSWNWCSNNPDGYTQ